MFGIYTLAPMEENPGTIKLRHISGAPHYFQSKLKAEEYLEDYRKKWCGKDGEIYNQDQLRGLLDFSRVLEITAAEIFEMQYTFSHNRDILQHKDIDSFMIHKTLNKNLFYDDEVWKAYTSVHSRNIYYKIY